MKEHPDKPKELTDEELDRMVKAEDRINKGFPRIISVDNTVYKVKQISKLIRKKIHALELEAYALSGQQKESMPLHQAKKIQAKLDRLHAKTAAYYLLGNKAIFCPLLFAITWRKIMLRTEEHSAMINSAAINDEEMGFSLANWENTKHQLALSMKPIGDGVRETLKRWRAAEVQVITDATTPKEEGNK